MSDRETSDEESLEEKSGGNNGGGFNADLLEDEPAVEQALFHLIFGSAMLVLGTMVLFKMFQYRNVLEIRARSAYLVMTLGLCLLAALTLDVHVMCRTLLGWPSNVFLVHSGYFFIIFSIESCYIWRVIRLGVSFSPRVKRFIPWVMWEKLAVVSSLSIGAVSTAIPTYYYIEYGGGDDHDRFLAVELDAMWVCHVALISIQLCLLPVVWLVDDIFRISWELCIAAMFGVMDIVVVRLTETNFLSGGVKGFVNSHNIGLFWTVVLFGLSVVDPVRRVMFNPIARPIVVCREQMRAPKRNGSRNTGMVRANSGSETELSVRSNTSSQDESRLSDCDETASTVRTKWSYDTMATVPEVAEAFRGFAHRALCQESIMFLEEVTKYESGDYSIAKPIASQFAAFNTIVKRFVADGALDEINIGGTDKERILKIFQSGSTAFFEMNDAGRRLVLNKAYIEIRDMLETNLLYRFLHTEAFRTLAEADPDHGPFPASGGP
ncbi:unnamed protein product [Ectocarpus sp. 6 AP-2014]